MTDLTTKSSISYPFAVEHGIIEQAETKWKGETCADPNAHDGVLGEWKKGAFDLLVSKEWLINLLTEAQTNAK